MKVKEVVKRLEEDGWYQLRQESSHRNFRKEDNPNVVTVPGQDRDDVSPGVLSDIRRKTGLTLR